MPTRDGRWPQAFGLLVFATDLLLVNGSFLAMSMIKFGTLYPADSFAPLYFRFHLFLNLAIPACLVLSGAYRDIARAPLGHQAVTSFKACVWAAAITVGALFLVRHLGYSRSFVSFHLAQVAVLIPFSRILLDRVNEAARRAGRGVRKVLVAGEREPLMDLAMRLRMAPHLGYAVEAVLPLGFEPPPANGHGPRIVRDRTELEALLRSGAIRRAFICDHELDRKRWKTLLELCEQTGVEARLVRWPLVLPDLRGRIHDLLSIPLVPGEVPVRVAGARARAKRGLDLVLGGLTALVLAPALTVIALAIKLDSHGPVFYRQTRLTRGGRRFAILKFRSMHSLADEERARLGDANQASGPLFKIRDDPRVTRVGRLLRRFSLDELPQILNVLRGDLSLVGPRPPLPEEVGDYEPWQRHRLAVVQGMTGLWQVSGRSRLSFEEMVLLDLHYIEHGSLLLDIEILMETLPTVLHGDGAY